MVKNLVHSWRSKQAPGARTGGHEKHGRRWGGKGTGTDSTGHGKRHGLTFGDWHRSNCRREVVEPAGTGCYVGEEAKLGGHLQAVATVQTETEAV